MRSAVREIFIFFFWFRPSRISLLFFSLLSFPIRRELRSFQRSLRRSGLKHRQATGGNMTNSSWRRKERFNDSSLYRAFCSLGFLPQKRGKARCNEINKRTIFSLSFAESEMKARMAWFETYDEETFNRIERIVSNMWTFFISNI